MGKKRKTRQQKIILQLKRQLASSQPRQEAILGSTSLSTKPKQKPKPKTKRAETSIFSYDPRLIKKDLLKTLLLTIAIISLELVLYLKLK